MSFEDEYRWEFLLKIPYVLLFYGVHFKRHLDYFKLNIDNFTFHVNFCQLII